jgi:MFS family permease
MDAEPTSTPLIDTQAWPPPRYAWYVVGLLTAIYAIAILDRVSLALLIQPLQAAFKINDMQFGLLQGMAFSIVYSLLGLPFGLLADRSNRVWILAAGLGLWSVAEIGCGFAHSFAQLFAARMLVGVGEAALVPLATSLIADYFAPDRRPRAFGVFVSGSAFGSCAALAMSGLFIVWAHRLIAALPGLFGAMAPWQVVLLQCGVPGLVLAAATLVSIREPLRHGRVADTPRAGFRPILALLRREPLAFGVYAIIGWFPVLFIRVHGWTAPHAGWMLGAVALPISLCSAFSSGWVIAWVTRRGHRDAPMLTATVSSLSFLVFGGMTCMARSDSVAILGYALMTVFVNWTLSSVYSGIALITPNELRGQMTAVLNIASGVLALAAGNFIVGFLSDTVFTRPDGIATALAVVFIGCGSAAMALLLSGRPAFRRAAMQMENGAQA